MTPESGKHLHDSLLEGYSMGHMPEWEASRCEEHLLVCESCRTRLEEMELEIRAWRHAAQRVRNAQPKRSWIGRFPALVPAMAAALLILLVGALWQSHRTGPLEAVILETTRGGQSAVVGPADKPLLLKPNLEGLPALPEYRLELVDAMGKPLADESFASSTGAAAPGLRPGTYFVRVYAKPATLLREYALQIKADSGS